MSRSSSGSGSPYRLDELGWLQFDRLCGLVLDAEAGVGDLDWRGQSDSVRVATVETPVVLRNPKVLLNGPVTVAVLWIRDDGPAGVRLSELAGRVAPLLGDLDGSVADELLVLTNLHTEHADAMLSAEAFVNHRRLVVMGAEQIGASVDHHHGVRAALPSVLGLRDLESLIDRDVRARSSLDVVNVQELARVFWPTRAYERARTVLDKHGFVVLTGPPEMGKTAIAQMLALAQLADGWEAHECTDPDQVWRVFDPDRRQVFVADDAFGSTEYRPDAAERWALGLGRLLRMLDQEHWLIWTSRPAPLKAGLRRVQRERGSERFPNPGEVLVDASDLDLQEKTLILFRHAKACGASEAALDLLRSAGLSIVEHPHFTPERIRRFVRSRLKGLPQSTYQDLTRLAEMVDRELSSPTEAMRNSFNALAPEHRDLLVSLLDAPAGLIDQRDLGATVRRHHPGGLSHSPVELIDRLTDHFLRVTSLGIGWVHPSWRDLVIDQLLADAPARQRFLAVSGVHGVMLALSQQGGGSGERTLPLLRNDADWDRLGDRLSELLHQVEARDLARLLLALDTAVAESSDPQHRREAQSLAVYVLETTRRVWNQTHQAVPWFLLEAWYRLRNQARSRIEAPRLSATWVELHPGSLLLERTDRDELLRADEWLAVAEILHEQDPAALEALGFYGRDRDLLARLIVALARATASNEDIKPIAESVLKRIEQLVPELAASARSAITIAGLAEDLEQKRWWMPEDIVAPPSSEPVGARTDFTYLDVARVLNDL
jgi:hypothetical protein